MRETEKPNVVIYTDMRNAEAIYPYGIYSMCPIIDASEKIA